MRKLLLLQVLFLATLSSFAQTTYTATYFPNAGYPGGIRPSTSSTTETTGWNIILGASSGTTFSTNTWSPSQTIPFPFSFYGQPVTDFKASTNMLVTFDVASTALPSANDNLPSTNLPDKTIAVFWDEFTSSAPTGSGDRVMTKVFGTAPNRQLWIFWFSFEYGNPNISFAYNAAVLEETTNNIYIVDIYNAGTALTTTVGVQLNSTTAVQFGNNQLSLDPNNNAALADVDYYRFSPRPVVATDASAIGLINPVPGVCYSATQPVEVTIKNIGTAPLTNIPVAARITGGATPQTLTGSFTGTLAPNATANVIVGNANMAAAGTYTIKAYTALATDMFMGNDTLLPASTFTVAPVVNLPQTVNFTGFTGSNLSTVFPGWTEMSGPAPNPTGTTSNWTSDDYGNVTTHINGTSAKINLDAASDNVWLVSPKITATATTSLLFDLALTAWNGTTAVTMGSDDQLRVMVSTDCGNTFTAVQTYSASTPISNTGQKESVSLAAYAGQNIIVALYATEGTVNDPEDNDLFFDNLFLGTPPAIDLAATVLVSPVSTGCFSATETVIVTINNFGTNAINFATTPATVTVNVTGAVTQTLTFTVNTGTLAPGASQNVTVGNLNMSTSGAYTFNGMVAITGDGDPTNDNLPTNSIFNGTISTFPALQDFETFTPIAGMAAGNAGWTGTTSGLMWEIEEGPTTSSNTGPTVDHTSGTATGNYVYLETSSGSTGDVAELITPCINLAGQTAVSMEFWYHMFGATIDTLRVDVFNGTTYINNVLVIGGQQQTTSADPWLKATVSLAPYSGNTIRVRFRGSRGTSFTGDIAIDDVAFVASQPVTAGGPTTFCAGGSVVLTAPSVAPGATYVWQLNGTAIPNATSSTYTATASGTYTVLVDGTASAPITITVNAAPATPTISQNGGILTSSAATGNQWYLNGTIIAGATGQTYTTAANGNYTVVTTANGCPSAPSAVLNMTKTGAADALAGMSIQVYPNPTKGSFNVKLNGYQKEAAVSLYNLAGQLIATDKVAADDKAQNIDIKGLAAGTYLLKVTSDKGVQVNRLIVQ